MTQPLPGFWRFVIITAPIERIRVIRVRPELGNLPNEVRRRGFWLYLTVGDRVYYKSDHFPWRLKFKLGTRMDVRLKRPTAHPAIKYGERYGPYPGQWRSLARLSQAAFDNAGIDPAWISKTTQGGQSGD